MILFGRSGVLGTGEIRPLPYILCFSTLYILFYHSLLQHLTYYSPLFWGRMLRLGVNGPETAGYRRYSDYPEGVLRVRVILV
jgi:hypothetical protein